MPQSTLDAAAATTTHPFPPADTFRHRHIGPSDADIAAMLRSLGFGSMEDFLKATIGDPAYFKVCKAPFVCGTPLASDAGMADVLNANAAKAKQLLTEAGYGFEERFLQRSPTRAILTRMIKNLLAIYSKLDDPLKKSRLLRFVEILGCEQREGGL
mgnify:CR=1 FL=1